MQIPSAPPAPPQYWAYQNGNNNQNNTNNNQKLDINDDCTICWNALKDRPDGDLNTTTVISKTKCNHFFHQFCLDNWLQKSAHKDCPNCRGSVNKREITTIPVSLAPVLPTQPRPANTANAAPQPNEGQGTLAWVANGTANVGMSLWRGIYNIFENAETIQRRKDETESRMVVLKLKWDKMPVLFNKQKEEIYSALATVRSLIANNSKDALKAVKKIEAYTKTFDQSILKAQDTLMRDLIVVQQELANVVRL